MIPIDILYLVDRLESAISKGFIVPFTARRLIDEDECLDIIEQMRIAIPDEIRQARKISQDKERVLAQAKEEAEEMVSQAQEHALRMIEQHELVRGAQERAAAILGQAETEAQAMRIDADQYARDILIDMQQRLDELSARLVSIQGTVNNGLSQLTSIKQEPEEEEEESPEDSPEPAQP